MDELENRTFDEIEVGDSASLTRTLTEKDIKVFAIMSGDINPAHVDAEYAESDMFKKIIGHGMWGGALISTVLGTQLPGPGTIYIGQTIRFKKPVAIGDTLTVTVKAIEKNPEKKRVIFECECRNQNDDVVMEGQAEVMAPTKKIRRPKTDMPEISLRRNRPLFIPYLEKAREYEPLRAAVIYPVHEKIIQAVHDAASHNFIDPILIGPKHRIQLEAKAAKVDISEYEIIDTELSHSAIAKAILMARKGEVGVIVRGGVRREELLPLMLKEHKGLLMNGCISNVVVLDVPTYKKTLILTDTLVNANPSLETKRCVTQNAINFAHALGIEKPKVAILAGVDTVNPTLQSTVDAAALCKMLERGQLNGAILDGPLTFDNVISAEVAKAKGITSPIIGDADILVVPNLETGNMLAKQLEYLAESKNAGLAIGGRVPVLMNHINDISLSTVSCAFAILNTIYQKQALRRQIQGE